MALAQQEKMALGFAVIAHLLLFALLSFTWADRSDPLDNPPMAVDIVAEAAPVSTAPEPATEPPAARRGEIDAEEPAPVVAPIPKAIVRPDPPPPTPKRVEQPAPRRPEPRVERQRERPPPTPPRETTQRQRPDRQTSPTTRTATPTRPPQQPARDTRRGGDPLGDIASDVARSSQRDARGTNPPATQTAAQVRQSIETSISAEVRAPWNSGRCRLSGVDMERLNTTVIFNLTQTGGLERIVSVATTGVTESNRPQVALFEECARRAIQTAAPFNLPAEHYDYWRRYELDFNKR